MYSDLNMLLYSSSDDEEEVWDMIMLIIIKRLNAKSEVKKRGSVPGRIKSKNRDYQASYDLFYL
jgi:hypothetical protein